MKQIEAIVEIASDSTFSVYCKDEIFSGSGGTITEAKEDMLAQMSFYKRTAIEEGFKYPEWMDEEYSIHYTRDAISLLKYFVRSGLFSLAGLEKLTGINQKQLWAYVNGTKPRKAQSERIVSGFRSLRNNLNSIFA